MENYINLTLDNLENEHLCCAIADKKHQLGVELKKAWLKDRIPEGHVFRKLDVRGKVFIEYGNLDTSWVPIIGENYIYVHCLWVSGSFKGKGHAKDLVEHCIEDAKMKNKSGVCVLSSKKKKPFLSEKKFFQKYGFEVSDSIDEYELLALSFDGTKPKFSETVTNSIEDETLTIYYGNQCPYIPNCIMEIENFLNANEIPYKLISVDSLEKAKLLPGVLNNWGVFNNGKFETVHLLNEGYIKKLLNI